MSGSTGIIVDAANSGSATITVCETSSANTCGTLSVTVTGSTASANQNVIFNPTNPTITVGQTLDVQLSGGATTYVVFWNQNDNLVQASMAGESTLALTGLAAGTDSFTICATLGGCSPLSVTVTGPTATANTSTNTATTATTATAQTTTPTVITTPTTEPGTVIPNTTLLSEIQAVQTALTQALSQIQSIQTEINQIEAQVNAGGGSTANTNVSASSGTSSSFTELLTVGSEDAQVTALQNRLTTLGFYSGPVTGFYGSLTEQAVMKYQTAHGIEATGEVGPATRTALNAGN